MRPGTKKPAFLRAFACVTDVVECPDFAFFGAEGGTRTHTLLRAADFESAASTDSATSARPGSIAEGGGSVLGVRIGRMPAQNMP